MCSMMMLGLNFTFLLKSVLLVSSLVFGLSGLVMSGSQVSLYLVWELFNWGSFSMEVPFLLDKYSLLFGSVVSFIAFSVTMFSEAYMASDKYYTRFHMLVYLFVFSMYLLIFSPSMVSLFLGWDGLGVSSYFLVIYFENSKSFNAGMLTALSNRVGDVFFLLSLPLFASLSSWNFFIWNDGYEHISWGLCLFLTLGACTKSAQFPFSAWLPAAMAAPTPVSALVHSSTLVTAGVYVMFRFSPLLNNTQAMKMLSILGAVTMILAGMSALSETDSKKIVALSTLSQLGLMMMSLGVGGCFMAFFHLLSHAFFKALLFMVVGNMIHLSLSYQDLRKSGVVSWVSPESACVGAVSNLSLMGLPFFSGFYSKDYCVEFGVHSDLSVLMKVFFFLGIMLTVLYSLRFMNFILGAKNMSASVCLSEKEGFTTQSFYNLLPLAVAGSAGVLWQLESTPSGVFLSGSVKWVVLTILVGSLSMSLWKINVRQIWVYEGVFFMWNLGFISSGIANKVGLQCGKFLMKDLEQSWESYVYWSSLKNFLGLSYLSSPGMSKFLYHNSVLMMLGMVALYFA